jgi:hypothetical protein
MQGVQKMHPGLWWDNELWWTFPSPPHWKQAFGIVASMFAIAVAQSKAALARVVRTGTVDA